MDAPQINKSFSTEFALTDKSVFDVVFENSVQIELPPPVLYSKINTLDATVGLTSQNLLIIDELGFVPLSKPVAELLFEVISQCYERGSIIAQPPAL